MDKRKRNAAIIQLAKQEYQREGEIEIDGTDEDENISEGDDNGAYVRAWVWVDFSNTPLDKSAEKSHCQDCAKVWPDAELKEIQHLAQRVAPGEPMPSGECPECGALCQPLEK